MILFFVLFFIFLFLLFSNGSKASRQLSIVIGQLAIILFADSRKKNRTFFKMQKDKFDRQVTLLRKYYSGTLEKREKQEFREMLNDRNLENVFRQLSQGDILAEKLEEYKQYDARKAFGKFSRQQKSLRHKKRIIRILTAAVVVLLLGMSWLLNLGLPEVEVVPPAQQETIRPGSYKAILRLTNGETVNLERDSMQVLEKNGTQISYAEGKITYRSTPQIQELAYNELIVPTAGECYITLEDHTKVWINAESKIKYPVQFTAGERKVYLEGEAYFEVAHNKEIPFYVQTENIKVQVTGTKFDVCSYKGSNSFIARLIEGSINLLTNNAKEEKPITSLTKGKYFSMENGKYKTGEMSSNNALAWMQGIYYFDDVPFKELLDKIALYYNYKITVKNPKILENYRCTGKFKDLDGIEHILKVIQKDHPFKYNIDNEHNKITIE